MELNIISPDTSKVWQYADIENFDEDFLCEIINGELYMSPSPNKNHQRVVFKLAKLFDKYISKTGSGEIFLAPLDVKLDDKNVAQPDIIYLSKTNPANNDENIIVGAPDLVLEVVSPYSVRRDYYAKLKMYEKFRIPEYWIVDPANQVIEVFGFKNTPEYELLSTAVIKGEVQSIMLEGLKVSLEEIFENE